MSKIENKKAQAAIELAVFGAILIFILGTIVRTAVSNGYTQNEGFKAMRMAMLLSWKGTELELGNGAQANTSHNSASLIFVEDRLSPDFNKYGDLDRTPYIAQGSGTFTFNLLYPWQPGEPSSNLVPIMDVYINGQHFPLTTASFVSNRTIPRFGCGPGGPYPPPPLGGFLSPAECLQNQCLRNAREWAGGIINETQFTTIVPVASLGPATSATMATSASAIFNQLWTEGFITNVSGTDLTAGGSGLYGNVTTLASSAAPFVAAMSAAQLSQIQNILQSNQAQYKLFYTREVNGTPQFNPNPPGCSSPPSTDNALCSNLTLLDASGAPYTNTTGDLQYDLLRNGDYTSGAPTAVEQQFGPANPANIPMRSFIAWQWAASAATTPASIGLNASSNEYPTYDIDGRLKEVTIYSISQNSDGTPTVSYEDFQGGDIDTTWDSTSCGPKPGLESQAQVLTFTKDGTYLQIKEGKLYNPETDQFVRSANKRDTIDVIQRMIQLSNDNADFCNWAAPFSPLPSVNGSPDPNPVEVCVAETGPTDNCFTPANIAQTCYDASTKIIYVRSRLEDRRGFFWMTDASGQLLVH